MSAKIALTVPMMVACLASCGAEDMAESAAQQLFDSRARSLRAHRADEEFQSNDGRRFVLAQSTESTRQAVLKSSDSSHLTKSVETMTLDELANALRPATLVDGQEYVLETPDYEAASMVMAGDDLGGESHNPDGAEEFPAPMQTKSFCCGTDGRSVVRNNTSWPYKTVIAMAVPDNGQYSWTSGVHGECTMQLIGASTATSVAHCFHNGTNWLELAMWGAGPDAQDSPIFPTSYPGAYGCYIVYIPTAWIGSGGNFQYDYAVIDFRSTCEPTPGGDVGWVGWGVYSAAEIEGTGAYGYGVPALSPYPQMHGMWTGTSTIDVGTYSVDHGADCSDGDSGRGLWQYIDSDWRSTANHSRGPVSGKCRDRRLTSEVAAFIAANSEY